MSARETHVTEWGLVACAGMSVEEGERSGMRFMTVACGTSLFGINDIAVFATVPTCPRCAVLRDEALEGRLPKREAKT